MNEVPDVYWKIPYICTLFSECFVNVMTYFTFCYLVNIFGAYRIQKYLIITLAAMIELGTDKRPYYFLPLNGGIPDPTVAFSTITLHWPFYAL